MGVDMAPAQSNKLRWGEMDEDEERTSNSCFRRARRSDRTGRERGEEGGGVQVQRRGKQGEDHHHHPHSKARLSKRAVERRFWPKFGDAVHEDVGIRLTMAFTEEIILERPRAPGSKSEETKVAGDPLAQLGKAGAVLMVCRTCGKKGDHWTLRAPWLKSEETKVGGDPLAQIGKAGAAFMVCRTCGKKGDHWTSRCPYKDLAQSSAERTGTDMRCRNEENSVRVTNLSEDTQEADLHELFRTFGSVSRVYVAVDQKTGMSRAFGFVNFVNKEEAEKAINKLNGYGYDNLILRVEWAAPRAN